MGTGGGTVAKNGLLAYAGTRTQCLTGGSRTSPAGMGPNSRIRGASLGQKPGGGTPDGRGTGWTGGDAR